MYEPAGGFRVTVLEPYSTEHFESEAQMKVQRRGARVLELYQSHVLESPERKEGYAYLVV